MITRHVDAVKKRIQDIDNILENDPSDQQISSLSVERYHFKAIVNFFSTQKNTEQTQYKESIIPSIDLELNTMSAFQVRVHRILEIIRDYPDGISIKNIRAILDTKYQIKAEGNAMYNSLNILCNQKNLIQRDLYTLVLIVMNF